MLHNLSSQPVFDEMSQQQYIREPRSKTSGKELYQNDTNVTPVGLFWKVRTNRISLEFTSESKAELQLVISNLHDLKVK